MGPRRPTDRGRRPRDGVQTIWRARARRRGETRSRWRVRLPAWTLAFVVTAFGAASAHAQPSAAQLAIIPPTLEQRPGATVEIQVSGGAAAELTVSAGSVERVADRGGTQVFVYHPPEPARPGLVTVRAGLADCTSRWGLIRLAAPAFIRLRTKPRSHVTAEIGGRRWGPFEADRGGHVVARVVIGPEDRSYRARSTDALGNHTERVVELEPPPPVASLVAVVCPTRVRAGESALVEVGGLEPPTPTQGVAQRRDERLTLALPPGLGRATPPVASDGASDEDAGPAPARVHRFRLRVAPDHPGGVVSVGVRLAGSQGNVREVALEVEAPPALPALLVEEPGPPRPPDPALTARATPTRRHAITLALEAGLSSNFGALLGFHVGLIGQYRFPALDRRLGVLASASVQQLRTSLSDGLDGPLAVTALAVPLEAGLGATLVRRGRVDLDVEAGAGAAWASQEARQGGTTVVGARGFVPSVHGAVVLRVRLGKAALVGRVTYRYLHAVADPRAGGVESPAGYLLLALGGEIGGL